jgi:hypothetical protein
MVRSAISSRSNSAKAAKMPNARRPLAVVVSLIGYVRVSKSDGTQTLAPQRDAMLAAGVDPTRILRGPGIGPS